MSWFKVDDKLHGSPKRLVASTEAMGLWVCAGSWARDKRTGGYIPREALRAILPDKTFDEALALATELVEAKLPGLHEHGFWIPIANGWQFHDWESMQPEDEVEAHRRETISKIRSEAGLRGAQARWQKNGKNGFANDNEESPGSRARARTGAPSPSPTGSDPESIAGAREGDSAQADAAPAAKSPFQSDAEREVFEYWATNLWPLVHGHGRAPRATGPRLTRIRARLREKRTVADLRRVVDAVAKSDWHLGKNDSGRAYIEPKTIFRNEETVDGWLAKTARTGGPQPNGGTFNVEDYMR